MAANEIPEEFKWIRELTKAQLQTLFVECRNQHKALQGRLKLAEGLAEALEESVHTERTLRAGCAGYPGWGEWKDAAEIGRKALAAWRAES